MLGDNEQDRYGEGPIDHPAGRGPSRQAMVQRGGYPTGYPSYEWYEDDAQKASSFDLEKYLRVLRRHWMIIAAAVILAAAGGIASVLLTTKIYTAKVTLQIDKEVKTVANMENFEATQMGGPDEFFQTQYGLLKSRSLAEATAKDPRLDLARNKALTDALGITAAGQKSPTTAQVQASLASYIQNTLNVMPLQRSRLVEVSISSPSAVASAQLANAVARNFIDTTLSRRVDSTAYATKFLQNELAVQKTKLEASERELAEYARNQQIINMGSSSDSDGGVSGSSAAGNQSLAASSLSAMLGSLNEARSERIKAEQRWRARLAQSAPVGPEALDSPTIQQLKKVRADLEAEYQKNLATYIPADPGMRQKREEIAGIDRQIEAEARNIQATLTAGRESEYRVALGPGKAA